MKNQTSLLLLIALIALSIGIPQFINGADNSSDSKNEWKKFEGAWFEVKYPGDFSIQASIKSLTSTNGYDSAFFNGPDNKVAFYVFSPQWSGEPSDIVLNKDTENLSSLNETKKNGKKIFQYKIEAKDGSYSRIYEDQQDPETKTRHVFGIKFKDQETFDHYKGKFEQFQSSLIQFAD